jgi:hypothetical protein
MLVELIICCTAINLPMKNDLSKYMMIISSVKKISPEESGEKYVDGLVSTGK